MDDYRDGRPSLKPSYLAVLILALAAAFVIWVLAGCERPAPEVEQTKSIGEPLYPRAVPAETPKPTPTATPSGWVAIQIDRWNRATVRPEKAHYVQAIAATITRNKDRYLSVEKATGVPWRAVAVIHNMEGSLNFRTHLANGDPLTAKTRHVPAGRIPGKSPPYEWSEAAIDALQLDHLDRKDWSNIGQELNNIELFNGPGMQKYHPEVPTPYLWAWSTIYDPPTGKYVTDSKWSSTAVSNQAGAAMILKFLP